MHAARVYVFSGHITDEDLDRIRRHLINPVETREARMDKPVTLAAEYDIPTSVATVEGFIDMDAAALEQLLHQLGLAMDQEDLAFLQRYFREEEKRDPTITEIRMVDTYWSDHCRHTTFLTHLTETEIADPMVADALRPVPVRPGGVLRRGQGRRPAGDADGHRHHRGQGAQKPRVSPKPGRE